MSDLFSNIRLIDYFFTIKVEIEDIKINYNLDLLEQIKISKNKKQNNFQISKSNTINNIINQNSYLKPEYSYTISNIYPKIDYSDIPKIDFETLLLFLPEPKVFITPQKSEYFMQIIKVENVYFYIHFLKLYLTDKTLVSKLNLNINTSLYDLYIPNYLCFISQNPFIFSFHNLLNEIFMNSVKNNDNDLETNFCFKYENILNVILYRINLPKYTSFQLTFCLGENVYNFYNDLYNDEISFKFLFNYISIEKVIKIYFGLLINSVVIFLYDDIEIIGIIIHIFLKLLQPLPYDYSIITNLTNIYRDEILDCQDGTIIGINKQNFIEINWLRNLTSNDNIIFMDIEENLLITEYNNQMRFGKILPKNKCMQMDNQLLNIFKNLEGFTYPFYHCNNDNNVEEKYCNNNNNIQSDLSDSNYMINKINSNNNISKKRKDNFNNDINKYKNNNNKENIIIQNVFYDLIVDIFVNFSDFIYIKDGKQLFNFDKFLKNKEEYYNLLKYMKDNTKHLNIFIDNLLLFYSDKGKKLSQKEIKIYEIFIKCINKKKQSQSFLDLFENKIYHTISISSPPYENVSYSQNNIFTDPFHEQLLKHNQSIQMNTQNISLDFDIKSLSDPKNLFQAYITFDKKIKQTLKNKFNNYFTKNLNTFKNFYGIYDIHTIHKIDNNYKNFNNNMNNIININHSFKEESKQSPLNHNKMLTDDIISSYNISNNIINTNNNNNPNNSNIYNSKSLNYYPISISNNNMSLFRLSAIKKNKKINKYDYMKSFNNLIKNYSNGEFQINISLYTTQAYCLCPKCNFPNNIWDIRKNFEFYKPKNEIRTLCKYCQNLYVPNFKGIIFEDYNTHTKNTSEKIPTIMPSKKLGSINNSKKESQSDKNENYKIHLFNYLLIDQLKNLLSSVKFEKNLLVAETFYRNISLILGEVKCIMENKENIKFYNIHEYINRTFDLNKNKVLINIKRKHSTKSKKSNFTSITRLHTEGALFKKFNKDFWNKNEESS